jgi:NAD(P)-dependent dehydrogenase (short-subunit alcohol dehydrogenase family)
MSKVAIVTGTSTGLGEAIAVMMAEQGIKTYATMRNLAKASDKLKTLEVAGKVKILALDVQNTESVESAVAQVIAAEGKVDILVNNAGAGYVRTTEQSTEGDVSWVMDVNFHGVLRCTKAVLPHMRKARLGHVINISSVGGLVGQPFNEVYCAAKFAVEGYTESLASYVQPSFNVKFSLVEPGGIQSEFANSALAHFQQTGGMLEDEYQPILAKYIGGATARAQSDENSGTFQTSEEVAEIVLAVANNANPPLRIRTSDWAENFTAIKTQADPDGTVSCKAVIEKFL